MSWTAIRTVTTQAAEGTTTPAQSVFSVDFDDLGAFKVDGRIQRVEISFDSLTVAGAPTSVTFGVWRSNEGKIDYLGNFTVAAANVGFPVPQIFTFHGHRIWVTVESFAAGSSPTASGTIRARPIRF